MNDVIFIVNLRNKDDFENRNLLIIFYQNINNK